MKMKSVNFVVLGDASIADELAKKGSVTDMTFYEKKSADKIFSFIVPSGFPEKIQPLIQSIALAEYAIVNIKQIDKNLGEQIVALDSMKMERGFVIANGLDEDVKKIIKSTVLENYEFVTFEELKQKIENIEQFSLDGPTKIIIDAAFEVKGVGTVALGIVRRGTLKKHDDMELFPQKKIVSVRSVQMHDDDVDEADSPGRVGVSLKGTSAEEISRGDIIAAKDSMKTGTVLKIVFDKNKFYKEDLNQSSSYHLCAGLQIKPAKISSNDSIEIVMTTDKPFAFEPNERCVVLDLNSPMRIVGSGTILQ